MALTTKEYYIDNWQQVILRMLRYKKPLVSNATKITQVSLHNDPNQKIYGFVDWVKSGRHNYCISHHEAEPSFLAGT